MSPRPSTAHLRRPAILTAAADGVVALEQNTQRARADDRWELGDAVTVGWLPEHSLVLR